LNSEKYIAIHGDVFYNFVHLPWRRAMNKYLISMLDVSKDYNGAEAIKNVTLNIKRNEFLTMLGPSGCGKTTTLRIIGGFEK
jgi:ABC-type transporter Mla maintaining outer membrane lipid asymmetry ATPase subunit MlaF